MALIPKLERSVYRWHWACTQCPRVVGTGATWMEAARAAVAHRRNCPNRRARR